MAKVKDTRVTDSFGTFLQTLKASKLEKLEVLSEARGLERTHMRLLEILSGGSLPETVLCESADVNILDCAKALTSVKEMGLVRTRGTGSGEIAELTNRGRRVIESRIPSKEQS
jgi:predicted transcriptional regulator